MPEFHSASQQLLSAFLGRRTGNAVGAVVLRMKTWNFLHRANSADTPPCHLLLGARWLKRQAPLPDLNIAPLASIVIVDLSSIIESRTTGDRNHAQHPDAAYTAIKMMVPRRVGGNPTGMKSSARRFHPQQKRVTKTLVEGQ
jgi:hypothetical protein